MILKCKKYKIGKKQIRAIQVFFLLMDRSWEQVESSADSNQSPLSHICIMPHFKALIGFFSLYEYSDLQALQRRLFKT